MAGQLRASVALSSVLSSSTQIGIKAPSLSCAPFSSSRNSYYLGASRLHFVSCRTSSSCGSRAEGDSKPSLHFQSSFWGGSALLKRSSCVNGSGLFTTCRSNNSKKKNIGSARAAGPAGTGVRKTASGGTVPTRPGQFLLIGIAIAYMSIIVIIPFLNVFVQAFSFGLKPFINNLFDPAFQSAVRMTLTVAGIVVPINTVFGLIIAIWVTRHDFPGKALLLSAIDLPFSISPVVVGLMLMLLYGRQGVFAPWLRAWNLEIVFALPGMIIATCFVTLPFVVREVIPVLQEMDPYEEEAARTMGANDWEVFWQVTLPNIRLGLLYGITLCNARAMGEFGAVSVISGNIIGRTQTLTLFVEAAYKEYNTQGAFSAALLLSIFAVITLVIKTKLEDERSKQLSVR